MPGKKARRVTPRAIRRRKKSAAKPEWPKCMPSLALE